MLQHFTDKQRQIFTYFDGASEVFGDPLPIHRRLTQATGGDPNKLLDEMRSEDMLVAANAADQLIPAVRYAFEMADYSKETGEGATEQHCWDALDAFLVFNEQKKTTTGTTPTCSPSSAPSSSGANSTTPTGSACG